MEAVLLGAFVVGLLVVIWNGLGGDVSQFDTDVDTASLNDDDD